MSYNSKPTTESPVQGRRLFAAALVSGCALGPADVGKQALLPYTADYYFLQGRH